VKSTGTSSAERCKNPANEGRGLALVAALGGCTVLLAALGILFGGRRVSVRGRSMAPLLENGDAVLVDRLAYWYAWPRRGDVALVRGHTADGPPLLLKRIIGLPGETVTLSRDQLKIDGQVLDLGRPVVGSSPGSCTLGPTDYFLLSDNLAVGTDSRHTGAVQRADLLGRAWLVYAPTVRRIPRSAPPLHRSTPE
jgi:signal peptidase I